MSVAMIAITTSSSTSVKPDGRRSATRRPSVGCSGIDGDAPTIDPPSDSSSIDVSEQSSHGSCRTVSWNESSWSGSIDAGRS
jgi:hypothetical protein